MQTTFAIKKTELSVSDMALCRYEVRSAKEEVKSKV